MIRVVAFIYRTFTANRRRIATLKANEIVASGIRYLAVLILLGWILIWFFASEESRGRLSNEVRQLIGGFDSGSDRQQDP